MAKTKLPKDIKVELPAAAPARTIEQIQHEYATLAAKVGQTAYQVFVFEKELATLNEQMQSLNFEAAAIKGAQNG